MSENMQTKNSENKMETENYSNKSVETNPESHTQEEKTQTSEVKKHEKNNLANNRFLIMLGVSIIAVSVLASLGIYAINTWKDLSKPTSIIVVNGEAKTTVKQDKAVMAFYIAQTGTDVNALNTEVDKKASSALEFLKSNGIEESDIETNRTSYPDYSDYTKPEASKNTRVEASFKVKLSGLTEDTSKANKLTEGLLKLGVSRFDQLTYDTEDLAAVCDELHLQALAKAYTNAQARVGALGGKTIVKQTEKNQNDGCGNSYYPMPLMARDAAMGSAEAPSKTTPSLSFDQEIQSNVTLEVEYR